MNTAVAVENDYHCILQGKFTAREAQDAIARVSAWWLKRFEGSAQNLNDVFTVRAHDTFVTFKVTEKIANKKIVWTVTDCHLHWLKDKTEWTVSQVVWKISQEGESGKIDFTHLGLNPEVECYGACVTGWGRHLKGSLLKLLSEGQGYPE